MGVLTLAYGFSWLGLLLFLSFSFNNFRIINFPSLYIITKIVLLLLFVLFFCFLQFVAPNKLLEHITFGLKDLLPFLY